MWSRNLAGVVQGALADTATKASLGRNNAASRALAPAADRAKRTVYLNKGTLTTEAPA